MKHFSMKHLHLACRIVPAVVLSLAVLAGCRQETPAEQGPSLDKGMVDYIRGYEAYQSGNRDAAVRALRQALTDNPDLITARALLADIYRQEGRYAEAARHYERLTVVDPYDYLNFYHLGVSNHFMDRFKAAIASYLKAANLRPDDPKTNMNLGLAFMALGQIDDALPYARRATELSPNSAAAWGNYALVLDSSGQHAEAEAAYRKSLDLDPTVAGVRLNYATNLIRQNRPKEAISLLEPLVKEQRSVLGLRRLGDAYAAAGQPDRAVEQYQAALRLSPRYYPAMNQIAAVRIEQYVKGLQLNEKARQEALTMWRQSLQIQPEQPQISQALKRWEEASLFAR